MILSLCARQLAHRRQHTIRITSKHNNIARMRIGDAWNEGIVDELDGVGAARVFRRGYVVVVGGAVLGVVDDVFEDGAEADCAVDLGFLRGEGW